MLYFINHSLLLGNTLFFYFSSLVIVLLANILYLSNKHTPFFLSNHTFIIKQPLFIYVIK